MVREVVLETLYRATKAQRTSECGHCGRESGHDRRCPVG